MGSTDAGAGPPLTFVQPVLDVGLPGVDGLPRFAAHVVDVGAKLPGPAQVDRHTHGQLLQTFSFLRQPNGLRVFLREHRGNKVSRKKKACPG